MKKKIIQWFLMITMAGASVFGQNIKEQLEQLAEDNGKLYVGPLVQGMGAGMNTGMWQTAKAHGMLGFDFSLVAVAAFAPKSEKTFNPVLPAGYSSGGVRANTVIGDNKTTTYTGAGPDIVMPKGLNIPFGGSAFLLVPQVSVGAIMNTDVVLRFVPKMKAGDLGKVGLLGFGVKHGLNQWIPLPLPVDVAAGAMYQSMTITDAFKAKATAFQLIASKSLLMLTAYGGVGMESSSVDVKYNFKNPDNNPNLPADGTEVTFNTKGKNTARAFAGVRLSLLLVKFFADVNVGKYTTVSGGLSVGIR